MSSVVFSSLAATSPRRSVIPIIWLSKTQRRQQKRQRQGQGHQLLTAAGTLLFAYMAKHSPFASAATITTTMTTAMTTAAAATATNSSSSALASLFYVIERERGTVRNDLPVWASKIDNPFQLEIHEPQSRINTDNKDASKEAAAAAASDDNDAANYCATTSSASCSISNNVKRQNVDGIPGAFQLLHVLSRDETERMVQTFDILGYTDDAAVTLPKRIRHNTNLNWIADDTTLEIIWNRCKNLFLAALVDSNNTTAIVTNDHHPSFLGQQQPQQPFALNVRFRVYRYEKGDYFKFHTDGSWPGSRVRNGKLIHNAFLQEEEEEESNDNGGAWSMYSFLIFLTEDFEGGETEFLVQQREKDPFSQPTATAQNLVLDDESSATTTTTIIKSVRTPTGGVLCFPHGDHPLHCLHASATINKGIKYIIRTDVLFQ